MKPICVPCRRFYRPLKTGQYFVEAAPKTKGAEPGLAAPDDWHPYKLWSGDRWGCPTCGAEIIVGVPTFPVAEHYQSEFSGLVSRSNAAEYTINDC